MSGQQTDFLRVSLLSPLIATELMIPQKELKFRFLLILMYLIVFYEAVFAEETSRTNIVTLGICAMTLICYYFNIKVKMKIFISKNGWLIF